MRRIEREERENGEGQLGLLYRWCGTSGIGAEDDYSNGGATRGVGIWEGVGVRHYWGRHLHGFVCNKCWANYHSDALVIALSNIVMGGKQISCRAGIGFTWAVCEYGIFL